MIQYFPIVTGSLTVLGNINVSGSITTSGSITISGSITSASFASTASFIENAQTASYVLNAVSSSFASTASFIALAQSASNAVSAATASFANTLTVAGNLTAQTLVVQTITSSVDFVTGSTRFGSILDNTHVFSGSVTMNPNGLFVSSSGIVGIGTITPIGTYGKLTVAGGISITNDNNAKLEIGRYSSGAPNSYIKIGSGSNSLRITDNADQYDIFTITNSGSVGIGTTSLTTGYRLEVNGSTKVNGTMVMNSPFIFRNKIQNGDMRIDQRYNGATISNTEGTRPVDRYIIYNQIASNWSTQRSTVAPPGFANSLLATSTTGGSIGAGSYGGIRHQIEGLNTIDLAWGTASAKNITVSFWVRSSVTGTYGFVIRNGNTNNYGYVSAYTISSANTWTYITLNIPGPTSGTWATDNLPSLNCIWDLGAGTSYSQAAGSWISASEILGLTGGTKFFTNSSATYYLTGVQLEIGDVATPFECLPYDVQLRQCQRYFQKWGNGVMFQAGQLGQTGGAYDFFKMIGGGVFGGGEMRDTPTLSYDTSTYWVGVGTAGTGTIGDAGTIPSSQYASPQSLHITKTGIGRLGIGDFNTFSPTPVRGRWYVPNSDFVWVSAEI
jgi:hypothetical protein